MFRFLRRLLIVLILLAAGLILARNAIGNWAAASMFRRTTGFPVYIGAMNIKLTRAETVLRDVAIRNPIDVFREPRAMEINRLDMTYAPLSLIHGKPHFQRVEMEIPSVVVVRNAAGEVNWKRIGRNLEGKKGTAEAGKENKFQIDELVLSVGNVLYVDESRGATQPRVFAVNTHKQVFKDVRNSEDVHRIIMSVISRSLPSNLFLIPETVQNVKETLEKGATGFLDMFRSKEPSK